VHLNEQKKCPLNTNNGDRGRHTFIRLVQDECIQY